MSANYTPVGFVNNGPPAISGPNLAHVEAGIQQVDNAKADRLVPQSPAKTTNFAAGVGKLWQVSTTATAVTATLPASAADGAQVGFVLVAYGTGKSLTIAAAGSDLFAGSATGTLTLQTVRQMVVLQYSASLGLWFTVASHLSLTELDVRFSAAGSSSETTGALLTANNLSEIAAAGATSQANARASLGLGSAATQAAGNFDGAGAAAQVGSALSAQMATLAARITALETATGNATSLTIRQIGSVALATSNGTTSASQTLAVTCPAGVTVGDLLIAAGGDQTASAVVTAPTGWIQLDTGNISGNPTATIYYRVATSGDVAGTTTYTWTFGPGRAALTLLALRNAAIDDHAVSTVTTSGTNLPLPSVSPSDVGGLLVGFVFARTAANVAASLTPAAGWTEQTDWSSNSTTTSNLVVEVLTRFPGSTGAITTTTTVSTPSTAVCFLVAVKPNVATANPSVNLLPAGIAAASDVSLWTAGDGTLADDGTLAQAGSSSIKVTPSGSPAYFYSKYPASAAVVVAGGQYSASAYIRPATVQSGGFPFAFHAGIFWFDSAGAFISSNDGTDVTCAVGVWTQVTVSATAPAGAVRATVLVGCQVAQAPTDVWNADTFVLTAGVVSNSATTAAPTTAPTGWTRVFTENFDTAVAEGHFPGTSADPYYSKWTAYPDGWQDTGMKNSGVGGVYSTQYMSTHDSMLDMRLFTSGGVIHMACPLPTNIPSAFTAPDGMKFARYSVRFKADPVPGIKLAWLRWPKSNNWPTDGEIDFPEGNLNGTISAFAHYANPAGGQDGFTSTASMTDWHVAVVEWTPSSIKFYLDGVLMGTSTTNVPQNPMYWALQTETAFDGSPTTPNPTATAHVYVDWVTIDVPA